uniref:Uncharacterized protein n=1 Tax=Pseudictyota dubia TaxID=2749911 RepID=A0A7R9W628_9STRA|mmetsp:Transcript_35477/g.65161  ORF Transcript_35477/g.65161 Transcript_35477/m.65161 type:complete len:170 (+) Transcript_35477:69-578(+)
MLSAANRASAKIGSLRSADVTCLATSFMTVTRRALATHHSGRFEIGRLYPVYIHPLSQIVLEHLQVSRSDWLLRKGLDQGLTINKDGTFVLSFPPEFDGHDDAGRIWTSYDADKKQHWVTVYKDTLLGRYPLKGSVDACWHTEKALVQETVDRLIERISDAERKSMAVM